MLTLYIPMDSVACAVGADAVAAEFATEAARRKLDISIVRTSSRGLFWLEPLVEIHALDELATVRLARPRMVGWNARDLADFSLAGGELARLRAALPEVLLVRESGLHTPAEAEAALAEGFDALLIGEALMRTADPAAFLAGIRGGR